MQTTSATVTALIEELAKLPGIGPKTAQRLTFYILRSPAEQARRLAEAITQVKESIIQCSICYNLTETDPCPICANSQRDRNIICVVEEPLDVLALEKTGVFKGLYHVLHGALSPIEGIGPRDLRIDELVARTRANSGANANSDEEPVSEVILATNPNYEGDYTAAYIAPLIARPDLKVTRLARGLPIGGDLEYADEGTLSRALEGRREL
ncbi:MAG TPA: recombination mediator RecR [Ktedonobacterales bacterium]|jgi:recombination protein RecR|nr:recombination mediator RecR [Ktedonobacterales bacterium]